MEKYIAIDNVCAWPNIKKFSNGELVAIVFNQPCHLRWEGTLDCWASSDNGRMWSFRSNPVINESGTNRGNIAVGVNSSDEIIVLCSGWDNVLPKPEKQIKCESNDDNIRYSLKDSMPLWPVCSISKDHGKSWSTCDIVVEGAKDDSLWIPYGDIITLDNGALGCAMYGYDRSAFKGGSGKKLGVFFMESSDNGVTWKCVACIHEEGNETTIAKIPNGKILAAVRSTHLDLCESADGGKGWRYVDFLTGKREYPAGFTILKEGYLLLTHGIRLNGLYGIGAKLMNLDDEKWYHHPMILDDFGDTKDGGYPSNVQLDNGEIVTAYYAKSVPRHSRYHMGVLIWTLQEKGIE